MVRVLEAVRHPVVAHLVRRAVDRVHGVRLGLGRVERVVFVLLAGAVIRHREAPVAVARVIVIVGFGAGVRRRRRGGAGPGDRDFLAAFAVAADVARVVLGLAEPGHVAGLHRRRVNLLGAGEGARIVGGLVRHQPNVVRVSPGKRDCLAGGRGQRVWGWCWGGVHALPVNVGCGRRGEDAWEQPHGCVRVRGLPCVAVLTRRRHVNCKL